MSLLISSTNNEHGARALGITPERLKQIEGVVQNILKKNEKILYTQIGELVSHHLDLNENEVFFVGMVIGSFAQYEFMTSDGIFSIEEVMVKKSNLGDSPMYQNPSLN